MQQSDGGPDHLFYREDTPTEAVHMLDFARRWAPFGGGEPGDIFVEFGLPADTYFRRLRYFLREHPMAIMDPSVHQAMSAVCNQRIRDIDPTPDRRTNRQVPH